MKYEGIQFLPGELKDRLKELRTVEKITASELAERTGIDASTLSRIENGKLQKVSDDVLLKLAKHFDVSTDFLLGLTNYPDKVNYTVEDLGLTELAVKNLYTGAVNAKVVSMLLEEPRFQSIANMIENYLSGRYAAERAALHETIAGARRFGKQAAAANPAFVPAAAAMSGMLGSLDLEIVPDDLDRIQKHLRFLLMDLRKKNENPSGEEARTITRKAYDDMTRECAAKKKLDPKTVTKEDIANVLIQQLEEQTKLPPRILREQKKVFIDMLDYMSKNE